MDGAPHSMTRRQLIVAASGVVAGAVVAGAGAGALLSSGASQERDAPIVSVPAPAAHLPPTQHDWNRVLATDRHGNRLLPRHHRLLMFELATDPAPDGAARLEAALRSLEHRFPLGPAGLMFTVGWGSRWFDRVGIDSPVPPPRALSPSEAPDLDSFAACLHLASDDPALLARVDAALTRGAPLGGARAPLDLRPVLELAERRTGFVGAGLPRKQLARLRPSVGLPDARSPLMMGFRSGMRRNQATEDDVTIGRGPWTGSTTMHVSEIALTLRSWYHALDERGRVAHMFAPQVTPARARHPGAGVTIPDGDVARTARSYGAIGHSQSMVSARRKGRPRILRRDFGGIADGQPLTHFVSLQHSIEDFERTRRAMNGDRASAADPRVSAQLNNGINEWLSVRRRANYLVPTRSRRSFPGLAGWDA